MTTRPDIKWHLPFEIPNKNPFEERTLENYTPMRFREEPWYALQDFAATMMYNRTCSLNELPFRDIINSMYLNFRRIPGDVALKVVAEALGLDLESREMVEALYEATLKVVVNE